MYRSIRTRHPGLKVTILRHGLACFLAIARHPGTADQEEAAPGLTVTDQDDRR